MLTASDTPTIRFAITRRLDQEPGIAVADIKFAKVGRGDWYAGDGEVLQRAGEPFIRVGLLLQVGHTIVLRSRFDLPDPFEIGHLHAEIDEVAEGCKRARKDFFTAALPVTEEKPLAGTGLRGRWSRYGLRACV